MKIAHVLQFCNEALADYQTTNTPLLYRAMEVDELMEILQRRKWSGFVSFKGDIEGLKNVSTLPYFKSFTRRYSDDLYEWWIDGDESKLLVAFDRERLKQLRGCKLRPFTINQTPNPLNVDEYEERVYSPSRTQRNVDFRIIKHVYIPRGFDKDVRPRLIRDLKRYGIGYTAFGRKRGLPRLKA